MFPLDTQIDLNAEFGRIEAQFNKICALKPQIIALKSKDKKEKLDSTFKTITEEQLAETINSIKSAKKDLLANISSIKEYADKRKSNINPDEISKINQRLASLQRMQKAASFTLKILLKDSIAQPENKKVLLNEALDFEKDVGSALKKARRSASIKPADYSFREKAFNGQLTPKNIAQLVGDAYIKDLKDSQGMSLEGAEFDDIFEFLIAALNYLPGDILDEFPTDQAHKFDEVAKQLQASMLLQKQIKKLFNNADHADFPKNLGALSDKITHPIQSLKQGETLLMPWGWRVKNGHGHAMLAEFKREGQDVLIRIYNTGAGLEDHDPGDKNGKSYANTIKNFRIPLAELKKDCIISRMLEPSTVAGRTDVMKEGETYKARELYYILEPYALPSQGNEGNWMKAQLSGTCTLRCVMAFLNYRVGGDHYKVFKNLLELKTMQTVLDKGSDYINMDPRIFRMLISRTNANLFRQELKRARPGWTRYRQTQRFKEIGEKI